MITLNEMLKDEYERISEEPDLSAILDAVLGPLIEPEEATDNLKQEGK